MKVIAAIQVDLEVTPLGTRSRAADELSGVSLLRRTAERVGRTRNVEALYILCPIEQVKRCQTILDGTMALVRQHDLGPAPWGALVLAARKWSLDGWRGGIGSTTCFDEYTDCRLLAGLLESIDADAVLSVPPTAPLLDPGLTDRMIEHRRTVQDDTHLVFTQAPPGVTGILLDAELVREVARQNIPVGWLFSYKPDNPQKDPIFQSACCRIPLELRHATGRLIGDTDRAIGTVHALLQEHDEPDAETVGRWLQQREVECLEPLPREVEIELTTDDPYPGALYRPRGGQVGPRGPIDPKIVEQVVGELSRFDDSLLVLGGFGEPLRHAQFEEILEVIHPKGTDGAGGGVYGLCVRTAGVDLTDAHVDLMITHRVDVLTVMLDAWTSELYGRMQSPNDPALADLDAVKGRLDRLTLIRQERQSVHPIIVPEFTKGRENLDELDDFYDGWLRRCGAACITGYSHRAGQCRDHSVMNMAPATRSACQRLRSRCVVLADGVVVLCDQDFRGLQPVGRIGDQSLEQIWSGAAYERIRAAHRESRFEATELCAVCTEWHRP